MDKRKAIKILNSFVKYLIRRGYKITEVFIFGSYATGNYHEDSDIDVFLVIKGLKNGFDEQVKLMQLSRNFDTRIEPHPVSYSDFTKGNPFIDNVLKNGIKIL